MTNINIQPLYVTTCNLKNLEILAYQAGQSLEDFTNESAALGLSLRKSFIETSIGLYHHVRRTERSDGETILRLPDGSIQCVELDD